MPAPQTHPTRSTGVHMVTVAVPEPLLKLIAEHVANLVVPNAAAPFEAWIGVAEAAEHIGCSPKRVYDLVEKRRIPHSREGRFLRFRRSELDDWLADGHASLVEGPGPP